MDETRTSQIIITSTDELLTPAKQGMCTRKILVLLGISKGTYFENELINYYYYYYYYIKWIWMR